MPMTISFCFLLFSSRRHRKARLAFLSIILLLCLTLHPGTEAQLNFSTGWGKRNQRLEWGALKTECASQTRPFLEQLLTVYQLIQERGSVTDRKHLSFSFVSFADGSAKDAELSEAERINSRVDRRIRGNIVD
ncbi:unnamed protein product [Heterotrigona itama]|uniref:Adipokinetic hormone n=1 Tax=Heterotrigona itama TaxID=395501 RepID=A0A6V7H3T7_9HYME|nr:unnamed protein product [Heterotrigona itama]